MKSLLVYVNRYDQNSLYVSVQRVFLLINFLIELTDLEGKRYNYIVFLSKNIIFFIYYKL